MLHHILDIKKRNWLQSDDCTVGHLLQYMQQKGKLRPTQIDAIATYLYLKIEGQNKPLWVLFSEGFFMLEETKTVPFYEANHPEIGVFLQKNQMAHALFDFTHHQIQQVNQSTSDTKKAKKSTWHQFQKLLWNQYQSLDYQQIIKDLFYQVSYADYLMSLPMGAGKTFLMAAFIYLDLYFAQNEANNPIFAHNFLVLIPSGLKSSIAPSLRSIAQFDPTWVIPEPAASALKRRLVFEVLEEQKSAKKNNRARNPNAQKVNQCLPNPFGRVFVVNAEKVILNRVRLQTKNQETPDEKDRLANELRSVIGQIPRLALLIDEVHHATSSQIKLRQVVNRWQERGNIAYTLGFSGTPYLSKKDKVALGNRKALKLTQIANTVYYYPLVDAIQHFLKTPRVKIGQHLNPLQIIRAGIQDFQVQYGQKRYENGAIAKLAIYCPNIQTLETEVYPFLIGELGIAPDEILKFHKGNKEFPQAEGSELAFRTLNLPSSQKRYILLVQVGKEGWDCPSLTGVILAQKGASPKNMVLQTACRCLRQVDANTAETAVIWLNDYNAQILNEQLQKEQNTSIAVLNQLNREAKKSVVPSVKSAKGSFIPKTDLPKTPPSKATQTPQQIEQKLQDLADNLGDFKQKIDILEQGFLSNSSITNTLIQQSVSSIKTVAHYNHWIFYLSKSSFHRISRQELHQFDALLKPIFDQMTTLENEVRFWKVGYDRVGVEREIRLLFV